MWTGWVRDRLAAVGLGETQEVRTLRLFGIGESQVADLIGDDLLRSTNPSVATYARADAVDVRISAVDPPGGPASGGVARRTAQDLADDAEAQVLAVVGRNVWARGHTTWPEALGAALAGRDWTLAITEAGTAGSVTALLGGLRGLRHAELRGASPAAATGRAAELPVRPSTGRRAVQQLAGQIAASHGTDVGLAVVARERRGDLLVTIAVRTPEVVVAERRIMFVGGTQGRTQAALSAADALRRALVAEPAGT